MSAIPRVDRLDSTLALLRDPYRFVSRRARACGSDVFEAHVLLERTIFMTGPSAAAVFSDPHRFERATAAPPRLQRTLFGRGGVQLLDGDAHRRRKAMFLEVTAPDEVQRLAALFEEHLLRAVDGASGRQIVLYDEARDWLTRVVCRWAGVPLAADEAPRRTRQLTALFEGAGRVGPRHWRARRARTLAERWAAAKIEEARREGAEPGALLTVASHRDADGKLLPPRVAAVELLNVLRPTVACAVWLAFVAHALILHPACRRRLAGADAGFAYRFAQEVRRDYPFFPLVAARVREDFSWNGWSFARGRRALLDLYGTNHDPRAWPTPHEFRPDRFVGRRQSSFDLIPQGEGVALELMRTTAQIFAGRLSFAVPEQDLTLRFDRMPALPASGVVLRNLAIR